jgi:hypothetical protein
MDAILEEQSEEKEVEQVEQVEEDIECLVCFQPCKELSVDLFLYACSCVYPVHDSCFKEWRRLSGSNRICMICRTEFDESLSEGETIQVIRFRRREVRVLAIEDRIEENTHSCVANCCYYTNKIIIILLLSIVIMMIYSILKSLLSVIQHSKTRITPS